MLVLVVFHDLLQLWRGTEDKHPFPKHQMVRLKQNLRLHEEYVSTPYTSSYQLVLQPWRGEQQLSHGKPHSPTLSYNYESRFYFSLVSLLLFQLYSFWVKMSSRVSPKMNKSAI